MRKSSSSSPEVYESIGALHMHTLYSDGSGTTEEIAAAAAHKKLDWIIITDHCHMEAKDRGEEKIYGPVVVLVGSELGDPDYPNHYLCFGIDEVPNQTDPSFMVREVQRLGGFGAIAHPHEKRDEFESMPPYPWTAWDANIDGIEIWNQLSQWVEGLTKFNRLHRFMHPLKSLTRPDPETLAVWDRLNLSKPVIGYVGVDAHALEYPLLKGLISLKVFHYKVQFSSLVTHLMLKKPLNKNEHKIAEKQVLDALRSGAHFGSNRRVGEASGFRFHAVVDREYFFPVKRFNPGTNVTFEVNSPLEADLKLIRNGRTVLQMKGKSFSYSTGLEGVWRVEAHRKGRGWVFTNPFRILEN
ncbi:PHP domain-containing protein [bacterium]|nr:PHP domain-containing protein [bacterium]